MVEGHIVFNVFVYAIVISYILYINFATYYNSGTNFLNFLIKLFNNWIFRFIFLLIIGFFALDLFAYGGFPFAILLTIAFLNTNMLVYKKEISESFVGGSDAAPFKQTYKEEKDVKYSEDDVIESFDEDYIKNDDDDEILEPLNSELE
jgi:hypothetical protein